MIVRVRTRDGTERITVPSSDITVAKLKEILETELKVPKDEQILSTSLDVLTSKTPEEFKDMSNGRAKIASCGIDTNGAVVHLMYGCEREPTKTTAAVRDAARGLTGRKMTVDDLSLIHI